MLNAIILAGTHADKTKLIYGKNKAFLELDGKPIILNVLNALQNSDYISQDKIAIVGPKKELEKIIDTDVWVIEESKAPKESRRFIENVIRAYDALSPRGQRTLIMMSDTPRISQKTIKDFVSQCNNYEAALYLALINTENIPDWVEQFKKSATLHLKGKGHYRTANMSLVDGSKIADMEVLESEIEKAFPIRRSASKYSKLCLYWFLAKRFPFEVSKYLAGRYFKSMGLREEEIEFALKHKPKRKPLDDMRILEK